jgi:hypothetical protein
MRRLAALVVVAVLAGCGGATTRQPPPKRPQLPRTLAQGWARQADAVAAALAAGDGCLAQQRAVALQTAVIDAIDAHRVGARFEEPLQSAVNDLAGRITCPPPPAPVTPPPPQHQHPGHGKGHGEKAHDHGKHKGHDR